MLVAENLDNVDLSYSYSYGKQDCLYFSVDKNISLLGITLCGSENSEYSVTIHIEKLDGVSLDSVSGKFLSVLIEEELHSFYGFRILFNHPIVIEKGRRYRIEASISGANSCFGRNGQKIVACSGINFSFINTSNSSIGTGVEQGQFPELLFQTM